MPCVCTDLTKAPSRGAKPALTTLCWVLSFCCYSAAAADQEADQLWDLSFESLLSMEVSVAATKSERIIDTPAIVSRYNADDMARMGLRTLKDTLSFIPGYVLQETRIGNTPVMIRGLVEGFNQKVLFLIDNVPYWMPAHSEIPLLGIPIEAISHVEVIRGPGAVYYGSNASAGVISVVTKKNSEKNTLALSAGSNNFVNGGGYLNHQFNTESSFYLAFEAQHEEGYDGFFEGVPNLPSFPPETPNSGTITKSEEMRSLLGRFTYKEFNILAQTFQSNNNDFTDPTHLNVATELEYTGSLIHLDNTWRFAKSDLNLFADYNNFYLQFPSRNLFGQGVDGGFRFDNNGDNNNRWRGGGTYNYHWNEYLGLFVGAEYEKREIEDYYIYNKATDVNALRLIEANSTNEKSTYGQLDYRRNQWRFLLGGRYTDNSQSGSKLTPRAAAVYKMDQYHSIKLLHSVGFNSPNFTQLFITIPGVLVGNPNLKAETVKTTDLAYSYEYNNTLFVANIYYLEAEDFIQREFRDGTISFFNSGEYNRYGFELDLQRATDHYLFFANFAYNHQGDRTITDDPVAQFVPKFTTAIGVNLPVKSFHSVGGSTRVISERSKANPLYLVNLNYQYQRPKYQLYATIKNLLDQDIRYPDTQDLVADHLIPGGEGIQFIIGAKYHF